MCGNEDVGGLNVTVNDTLGMSGIESICYVDPNGQDGFVVQWFSSNPMLQGRTVQKFHNDERLAFVLADFVYCADVGTIESGSRPRLAAETFQCLRVAGQFVGQKLQGNESPKFRVFGLKDDAHAATTQLLDNSVVRNGVADPAI